GLAKQEVNHQSDGAWHEDDQHSPQADIHSAPAGVACDVADHEREEGDDDAPGEAPEKAKSKGWHVVLMFVEIYMHNALDSGEKQCREHYRPHRDQTNLFRDLGLLFVHHGGNSWFVLFVIAFHFFERSGSVPGFPPKTKKTSGRRQKIRANWGSILYA